jgi:hypothetical protein
VLYLSKRCPFEIVCDKRNHWIDSEQNANISLGICCGLSYYDQKPEFSQQAEIANYRKNDWNLRYNWYEQLSNVIVIRHEPYWVQFVPSIPKENSWNSTTELNCVKGAVLTNGPYFEEQYLEVMFKILAGRRLLGEGKIIGFCRTNGMYTDKPNGK